MEFALQVLHGWLGQEVEVTTHGADGDAPVSALYARGVLSRDDELDESSKTIVFTLTSKAGEKTGQVFLVPDSFRGADWLDDDEEVLELRSGVIWMLISPIDDS